MTHLPADDKRDLYRIALTLLPKIGSVMAKQLVSYCGGVQEVFDASFAKLKKAPGIGDKRAREILDQSILDRAEEELQFVRKNDIELLFYLDEKYPKRLKHCYDDPVLLYHKGNSELNNSKVISIVGTRNATDYGKQLTQEIVTALAPFNPLIVSGLAYGIDINAHKTALDKDIQTVGVLGHGLDRIYPAHHKATAAKMLEHGGLLTEFISNSRADKENFPKRNRIVAGMADATIVVETKMKGGSMITATLANDYDRDVFAVPGKIHDQYSQGCNYLIRTNRAQILDSTEELISALGWEREPQANPKNSNVQTQMFVDLLPDEQQLVDVLKESDQIAIDDLMYKLPMSASKIASLLLTLELKGVVRTLPGKQYKLA